jgi:hypothetical protein
MNSTRKNSSRSIIRSKNINSRFPSKKINKSFNLREGKGHGPSKLDRKCFKYLNGYVKLDGPFLDNIELIEFYEFRTKRGHNIKYKNIPNGDYVFVLGYGNSSKDVRLGLVKINPDEFYSYHYSLLTLMRMRDESLSLIIAGEMTKTENKLEYSDLSGTFFEENYIELIKYIDPQSISNNSKLNNKTLSKYIPWINENITPLISKLLNLSKKNIIFTHAKSLINANSENVRDTFVTRCQFHSNKKLVYAIQEDCIKAKNPVGNVCDNPVKLLAEMAKHTNYMKIKFETMEHSLQEKIHKNINELTIPELFTSYKVMELPIAPITPITQKVFIKRLKKVLVGNKIIRE